MHKFLTSALVMLALICITMTGAVVGVLGAYAADRQAYHHLDRAEP